MAATRVLLVEDLDALGADVADARERAARLEAAGCKVTWVAVAPHGAPASPDDGAAKDGRRVARGEAGSLLRDLVSAAPWERILLASAWRGGGPLTRWLPGEALWWPTGLHSGGEGEAWTWIARRARGERVLPPLDHATAWGAAWLLGWSQVETPASRRPGLPLWDGDLVLALEGLAGSHGGEMLAAFAVLAEAWSGLDLVGWSHPAAEVERRARVSGVEMRVHHVGPPPRLAESSWLAQASASVLAGGSRISSGLVLRVLAAGCPLLWVAPDPPADGLARWLVAQGCAEIVPADSNAIAEALERAIERGPEVEAAVERGRALAAHHDRNALIERLEAPLNAARPTRRAA